MSGGQASAKGEGGQGGGQKSRWPRIHFRSLRRSLLLLTLGAVLPGILVLAYASYQMRQQVVEEVEGYALRQVLAMAALHDRVLDNARVLLLTLSRTEEFRRMQAPACQALVTEFLALYPAYESLVLTDAQGRVLAQAPPSAAIEVGREPYFQEAMTNGRFATSAYMPREDGQGVIIRLAQPILDQNGLPAGALMAVFDLNYLMNLFADSHLPPLSVLTMTDASGTRLTRFPETKRYTWVPDLPRMIERMTGPEEEGTFLETGVDGVRRLYSFKRQAVKVNPALTIMFRLGIPVEHALAEARTIFVTNLVLLILAAAVALFLARLLAVTTVLRPLGRLVDAAERVGQGDLAARTGLSHGEGELGKLAQAFDAMAASLQKRERENRQAQEEIEVLLHEKLECLDRLARCVAHELRNPVATIGGLAARMLKQAGETGSNADYLRKILSDTGRLERIVKEVREYADLPLPSLKVEDLGVMLGYLARSMGEAAEAKGVSLELKGEAGREGRVMAWVDAMMLEKGLRLLMANALEAMPQGGRLTLGLCADKRNAIITVADTGKGVANDDIPFLFDPFFTTKADAVGISLSIVKRIASEHDGDVNVSSELGKGSTFTLNIPLGLGGDDAAQDAEKGRP